MRLDRARGTGPSYYRIGKTIRYRVTDLEAFLSKCYVSHVEQQQVKREMDAGMFAP